MHRGTSPVRPRQQSKTLMVFRSKIHLVSVDSLTNYVWDKPRHTMSYVVKSLRFPQ